MVSYLFIYSSNEYGDLNTALKNIITILEFHKTGGARDFSEQCASVSPVTLSLIQCNVIVQLSISSVKP